MPQAVAFFVSTAVLQAGATAAAGAAAYSVAYGAVAVGLSEAVSAKRMPLHDERPGTSPSVAAWQPITGCSPISPGCRNCHGMKVAGGALRDHESRVGLVEETKAGPVWNGRVRLNEAALARPAAMQDPRQVAVCSHGDLFHEAVPDAWIDRVFDAMEVGRHHVYQVLTKRPARMARYVAQRYVGRPCEAHICFGVSVERQQQADERLPALFATPAVNRYVTCYPLLGPVDLVAVPGVTEAQIRSLRIVAVGEEAERPADPAWSQAIAAQMRALGVICTVDGRLVDDDSALGAVAV